MKDLDFDELDRAVNSLMSGVPKAEPAKDDSVNTVTLQPATPSDQSEPERAETAPPALSPSFSTDTPVIEEQQEPGQEKSAPSPIASVPPAIRRRGRFMDVVRPASTEVKKPAPPSQAVSRQGVTLQPSSGFARPVGPSIDGITPPAQPAPKQPDTPSSGDWPDPLEAVEFDKTTEAVTVKAAQTESTFAKTTSQNTDTQSPEAPASLTSPFLPGAKVEKRPLGRPVDADVLSQPVSEPDHAPVLGALASSESDESQGAIESRDGDMAVPQQPLPAELGQDVMAIEADTSSLPVEAPEPEPKVAAAPAARAGTPAPAPPTARPVATSIPQQYKVHPTVAEPSSGAIYDTATYHQPLAHPAKKKSGWLWVVAIILILALGAASGAAVYFFGLV